MKSIFTAAIVIIIGLGAALGGLLGRFPVAGEQNSDVSPAKIANDYRQALSVVEKEYVSPIDHEKITDSSIQSMLWTLDPHSSYFNAEEFRKLREEQASEFYGIGVSILQHRDGVYIQSIVPGTPAEKAGLRYGDRFLEVDGKDATDWTSAEVSRNVRGPKGTPVKIKIERAGVEKPIELEIIRGGVPLPSIRNYFMLPSGIGYVGLTGGFQETTNEELGRVFSELKKQGMNSVILDLRNNPGGILEQAIAVVSRFIPPGKTVVTVKGRSQYAQGREIKSIAGERDNFPIVIIINGSSASASEIVAGALQDYGRAEIVGTTSFGKGLVQRVFILPYNTGLTLVTARYYTPFGRSLQRDYSSGSIYDYYTKHEEDEENGPTDEPIPAGQPVKLPDGRTLMSGRGVEPDIKVNPEQYTPLRGKIIEAAFYFTRQLVAGQISGFENYKVDKQSQSQELKPGAFLITDKLFESFKAFAVSKKENELTSAEIDQAADFARLRLRAELVTANLSSEAGSRVILEADPQVLKAIEAVPIAAKMVDNNLAMR
jgi:carboxyl-terminal processing protease